MSNIYKENYENYIKAGFSVIPDKYGSKMPAIRGWTDYCRELPQAKDLNQWLTIENTNIAVACGPASGIIVLDFDCVDETIIKLIDHMLPSSPVERTGSKGWARFFRYNGEHSYALKDAMGNVVMEVLSTGKKCTIPPSRHPNGLDYQWTGKSLLEVSRDELPYLPPTLLAHIESKLRASSDNFAVQSKNGSNKIVNGRNDALVSLCGKLIQEAKPVDEAIQDLIAYDKENHEKPLFEDYDENRHTEPFTNAITLYSNVLNTINNRRCIERKEYEIPILKTSVNETYKEEVLKKKEQKKENPKKVKESLPKPTGIMGEVQELILANSFIKQPELAFGASLALMAIIVQRNVMFLNNAPNLYILNTAPSGSGKDAPQQTVKNILLDVCPNLLGATDYVSDAALMDPLLNQPARLDIIDEASGLLKTVNKKGADYANKMADILCELFTTSTSKFLGRQTAEGRKGERIRPHVSILMSCTPRGLQEGLDIKAIEKGLLGRVLFFEGDSHRDSERLRTFPKMSMDLRNKIMWWISFEPPISNVSVGDMEKERVLEIQATPEADILLDSIFTEFDGMRKKESNDSVRLPIIARLFQQLCKIAMLHACSRTVNDIPAVNEGDVEFAKQTVLYCFNSFCKNLETTIHDSPYERDLNKILCYINRKEGVSKTEIGNAMRSIPKKQRDFMLEELVELKKVVPEYSGQSVIYHGVADAKDS